MITIPILSDKSGRIIKMPLKDAIALAQQAYNYQNRRDQYKDYRIRKKRSDNDALPND